RAIGSSEWSWEAGRGDTRGSADDVQEGLPIRIFIFSPFIALVLVMVGATAIVALRSALLPIDAQHEDTLVPLLQSQAIGTNGRAFIVDRFGKMIVSSAPDGDPVVRSAVAALARRTAQSGLPEPAIEFQFDHVT